jgi:hypothetical protein
VSKTALPKWPRSSTPILPMALATTQEGHCNTSGVKHALGTTNHEHEHHLTFIITRDENGTEIFRIDRFRFLYYEPFFNMKNYQFQLVSQPFSTIFCTL